MKHAPNRALLAAVLSLSLTTSAWAGFNEGLAAANRGDDATALEERLPLANGGNANAQYNLAIMYDNDNGIPQDNAEAAKWYRKASARGNHANAFNNRGLAYHHKGEYDRAIRDYDQAIRLEPDFADAFNNKARALNDKAWELATSRRADERDGLEAVRSAQEAVRIDDKPNHRGTLAAAYAEAGQFGAAVAEQERAIEMLRAAGRHDQVADFQTRLDLYLDRQPYRQ